MASAGANVNHIVHVQTQLPYVLTVAVVSFVCFVIAGFVQNWVICLVIGIVPVSYTHLYTVAYKSSFIENDYRVVNAEFGTLTV